MATRADDEPRTAAEVINRVQIDWAALEYGVASLTEAELTAAGPESWSVKDHLMHVADWEKAVTAVLRRRPQHEGFGLDEATYVGLGDDLDGINDLLYRRSTTLSITEVQAQRRRAHADVLDALAVLNDADIHRTIAEYVGSGNDERPLLQKIAGDTYRHYPDHLLWINQLLRHLSAG